jgi:hypothetical protein
LIVRTLLLNESLFLDLDQARQLIGAWVADYNTARPHSSLGYKTTPAAFAGTLTAPKGVTFGRGSNSRWMKVQWQVNVNVGVQSIYLVNALRRSDPSVDILLCWSTSSSSMTHSSLHNQHGTWREVRDATCSTANQPLIEGGMAPRADDEEIDVQLSRHLYDVSHGMPRNDVRVKRYPALFRHRTRANKDLMKASRSSSDFFTNLLDKFRYVIDLFYAYHVQLTMVVLRDRDCQ